MTKLCIHIMESIRFSIKYLFLAMEGLAKLLQDTLISVREAEEGRSAELTLSRNEGKSWKADEFLKSHLSIIVDAVKALSDSCTKLTLVSLMNFIVFLQQLLLQ